MSKIRLTSARKAVLDVLKSHQTHLSPVQIHEEIIERLPSLNISTVYRALDYLVEHNLATVSDLGTGSPMYEKLCEDQHHHLVCLNCKQIMELEHQHVSPFFSSIEEQYDFSVETHHLVLYGICKNCQKKDN